MSYYLMVLITTKLPVYNETVHGTTTIPAFGCIAKSDQVARMAPRIFQP